MNPYWGKGGEKTNIPVHTIKSVRSCWIGPSLVKVNIMIEVLARCLLLNTVAGVPNDLFLQIAVLMTIPTDWYSEQMVWTHMYHDNHTLTTFQQQFALVEHFDKTSWLEYQIGYYCYKYLLWLSLIYETCTNHRHFCMTTFDWIISNSTKRLRWVPRLWSRVGKSKTASVLSLWGRRFWGKNRGNIFTRCEMNLSISTGNSVVYLKLSGWMWCWTDKP